jgi:hypothetical protein
VNFSRRGSRCALKLPLLAVLNVDIGHAVGLDGVMGLPHRVVAELTAVSCGRAFRFRHVAPLMLLMTAKQTDGPIPFGSWRPKNSSLKQPSSYRK